MTAEGWAGQLPRTDFTTEDTESTEVGESKRGPTPWAFDLA